MTFKLINQKISKHQPKYQKEHILKFRAIYKINCSYAKNQLSQNISRFILPYYDAFREVINFKSIVHESLFLQLPSY